MNDEREKKSWREIDSQRNRSKHVSSEGEKKPQSKKSEFQQKQADSAAKAALEGLFSGKKSKEVEAAWKNVVEGPNKTFSIRANHYVEKHGLPQDWDDMIRLLDHSSPEFVIDILGKMMAQAPNETTTRKDLLIGKLRVLKIERDEDLLIKKFEEAISKLSALNA